MSLFIPKRWKESFTQAMETSKLSLTQCRTASVWDEFVAASPQSNIFCRTVFLDAMDVEYDLWIMDKNGQPQALALVARGEDGILTAPQPFTLYQGLLFAGISLPPHHRAAWTLEITEALLKGLSERYDKLSFCMHYAIEDLRGVQWFHYHEPELGQFKICLRYTGLIDLSAIADFEAYMQTIRRNRQRDYRKSQSDGLSIEESEDVDIIDYLHKLTFERQGLQWERRSQQLLRSITMASLLNGFGQLLIARTKSGEPCSATLFLFDDHCGYSMFGATDPRFRNNGSYTFVTLESLRRCKDMGLSTWDFLGINSPQRGDFKTSLNAMPRPYFEMEWEKKNG